MEISGKGEFGQAGGSAFSHGLSATDGGASGIFSNFSTLLTLLAGDTGELSLENPLKNFEESAPEAEGDAELLSNAFLLNLIGADVSKVAVEQPEVLGELKIPLSVSSRLTSLTPSANFEGTSLTNAFIDTRIELHNSDLVVDNSETDILILNLEELMNWSNSLDPSKGLDIGVMADESTQLKSLQDLFSGTPLKLEIGHEEVSTIVFDLRDLKASILKTFSQELTSVQKALPKSELFIPQVIPLSNGDFSEKDENFENFVPIKIELANFDGNLGRSDVINVPQELKNQSDENYVVATRTLEIDQSIDPRSKLLIGLHAAEDVVIKDLPDFVRFEISMKEDVSNSLPDVSAEKLTTKEAVQNNDVSPILPQMPQMPQMPLTGSSVSPEQSRNATQRAFVPQLRSLTNSLSEMSDDPSKPAHIITKTIPEGEILKLSPTFRIEELINRLQSTVASESGTVQFDVTSDKASVLDQRLNRPDVLKVGPDIIKMDPSGIKNDAEVITNKFLFNAELTKFSNFKHALRFETATSIPALNNSVKNLSTSGPLSMSEFLANNSGKLEFGKFLSLRAKSATSLNRSEFHQNKQSALPDLIIDKVDKNLIETKPLPSVSTAVEQPIAISVKGSGSESIVPNGAAKISLYNAQYASRIGMLIVDKLLQGQENFEFQLEPESFGKIKVNVLLDKQSLDIRMVAETQAAASILKTNEEALSQITGQNGMKLASFSVGTQSGSDQSGQSPGQNKNKANENSNRVSKHVEMQTSQGDAYYRNSTGLNLIA